MPEVRLDSFEIDDSNKFAVALCKALVNLEKGYSPLFIHGERGSGKTHLLTAVSTELKLTHPEVSLLYIGEEAPLEQFFGENDDSNGKSEEAIARELGKKDFLIVDNLERIPDNPAAHEKFSILFDTFVDSGKQILVASNYSIKDLRGFDKRFISRLKGGVDAHLAPPRPETRLKILKQECARLGLELEPQIMQILMREAGKDAQYLKKLPGHLKTFTTLNRHPLTKEKVEEFLVVIREQAGEEKHTASSEEILSSWVQVQAKKREGDLQATLQEYEQQLATQKEQMQQLQQEMQALASSEKTATSENAKLSAALKKLKGDLDEKNILLKSQGKVVSSEIVGLTKEIKERDRFAEKLKADYEKNLDEKEEKISELEQLISQNFQRLAEQADQHKRAEHEVDTLKSEINRRQKDTEDQLLALKIQLEDREEKLELLREEREKSSSDQEKEKSNLEETHEENLLLKQAVNELNSRIKEVEKQLAQSKKEAAENAEAWESATQENEKLQRELRETRKSKAGKESAAVREAETEAQRLQAQLEEKNREIAVLQKAMKGEHAGLQEQINSLKKSLEKKEQALTEAVEREKQESAARKKLRDELNSAADSQKELVEARQAEQSRAQSLEKTIAELNQRAQAAESELDETIKKLKESSHGQRRAREELDKIRSERDRLKQELSGLSSELLAANSSMEQQGKALAEKTGEIERLASAHDAVQEQLVASEEALLLKEREGAERIRNFHEEMKKRDEELQAAESELKKREAALKEAREQNEGLNERLSELSEALATAGKEKEQVERSLSQSFQQAQAELEEKNKKLADLRLELEDARQRADELETRLYEAQENWDEQIAQQENEWAEREKSLENKSAAVERELQESTVIIKRLKTHVADLEDRVRQRDQLLEAKEKGEAEHILKLKDELKRRNEEIQKVFGDLSAATDRGDELEHRVSELSHELANVRAEKQRAEESSSSAIEVAEKQLLAAREQAGELESNLQEKQQKIDDLEKRLEEQEQEVQLYTEHVSALQDKIEAAVNEKASFAADKQKLSEKIDQTVKESEEALQASSERLQEARERVRQAEAREEELLGRLESERISAGERLERQRSEAVVREKTLADAKTSLEVELKAMSDQLQKFKLKTEEAQHDVERQVELKDLAEQDALRMSKAIEEKDQRITELQRTMDSMRQDFSQKMAAGADAQFLALEKELTARERSLAMLRQDYSELQADYDKLKSETSKAEKGSAKLTSEKKKIEHELKSRDDQIKQLKKEVAAFREGVERVDDRAQSHIQQLEQTLAEKEELLKGAEAQSRRAIEELAAQKDDEIAQLQAEHDSAAKSLKHQVQNTLDEVERMREEYEKYLLQHREENDALRARLAKLEREQAAAPQAQVAEPAESVPKAEAAPAPQPQADEEVEEIETDEEPVRTSVAADIPVKPVDWLYSFADFRCSDLNSFTKSMAEKIAKEPARLYNPLCIYGPPNSGKTHLLHAFGNLTTSQFPNMYAEVLSLNSLLEMIAQQDDLIAKWPNALGLLLIDDFDISTISPEQQNEMNSLLSKLRKAGTQIAIASEDPPIKMENMEKGMLEFLEAGLLAKLEVDPQMQKVQQEAVEAIVSWARALYESPKAQPEQAKLPAAGAGSPDRAAAEEMSTFLDKLLAPDSNFTVATFQKKDIIGEFEEIFKNPNKRRRNKFPLLVMEEDRQRRTHFFQALAHRLQGVFTGPVTFLSIERLSVVLSRKQPVDWNGLLNRLIKSHVVLIDDCESVSKLPSSTTGYLRAIIEEVLGRDILLMIGMSKKYKKEPIFGPACKKGSKKKI